MAKIGGGFGAHDPPSIFSHKGTQRVTKKNKPPQNDPNKKFLEVVTAETFLQKGFWSSKTLLGGGFRELGEGLDKTLIY